MTIEFKLFLLERILKDWEKPHCDLTDAGFCYYLRRRFKDEGLIFELEEDFPELDEETKYPMSSGYKYDSGGWEPEARKDRVESIKRTIEKLKNKLDEKRKR